jgi:hypothetical protein
MQRKSLAVIGLVQHNFRWKFSLVHFTKINHQFSLSNCSFQKIPDFTNFQNESSYIKTSKIRLFPQKLYFRKFVNFKSQIIPTILETKLMNHTYISIKWILKSYSKVSKHKHMQQNMTISTSMHWQLTTTALDTTEAAYNWFD